MAKNIFVGVNSVAKKPKYIYVGVNGVAKRVTAAYVGVNGVARKVWPAGVVPNNYTQLEYLDLTCYIEDIGISTTVNPRIVMEFTFVNSFDFQGTQTLFRANALNEYAGSDYITYMARVSESDDTLFRIGYYGTSYDKSILSNASEHILLNTRYKLDFLNGNNVYLYNSEGYYSIASHNLLGSFTKQTIPSSQSRYEDNIQLGGVTDGYNRGHYAQCYGIKMYNGSTLIRDLYPCYTNNYKYLGYYDLVDKIFFEVVRGLGSKYDITYDYAVENNYLVGPIV